MCWNVVPKEKLSLNQKKKNIYFTREDDSDGSNNIITNATA
jgi:hypothetical protein